MFDAQMGDGAGCLAASPQAGDLVLPGQSGARRHWEGGSYHAAATMGLAACEQKFSSALISTANRVRPAPGLSSSPRRAATSIDAPLQNCYSSIKSGYGSPLDDSRVFVILERLFFVCAAELGERLARRVGETASRAVYVIHSALPAYYLKRFRFRLPLFGKANNLNKPRSELVLLPGTRKI